MSPTRGVEETAVDFAAAGFEGGRRMIAGIVFYRRQGDGLIGRWSHESLGGRLAEERVAGVAPGSFTGRWPVRIFDPAGKPMFAGQLESTRFGDSLKLSWRGKLMPDDKPALFEGIGYVIDPDTMCASFEQVALKSDGEAEAPQGPA
ncbi:MAG: hypothetical protein QOJ91_3027 [Sphingomonadales bacterium]|nr:hypothetical protein [Sphingomonadales bacterium]